MWWRKKPELQSRDEIVRRDQERTAGRKNYFAIGSACFDQEQIDRLKALADEFAEPSKIVLHGRVFEDKEQRSTLAYWLPRDAANDWVYEIITGIFTAANAEARYDIVPSVNDPIQILRYDATDKGVFVWHADTMPDDMTRKMSVVIPLSDPADYEGGELEFNQGGAACQVVQEPGKPIIFPSWLIHQVAPVTAGRRYSLVAWIRGPNWR